MVTEEDMELGERRERYAGGVREEWGTRGSKNGRLVKRSY